MVEKTDVTCNSQNIVKSLLDIIINEVMKVVSKEVTDSNLDSCDDLKVEQCTPEELLGCSILKGDCPEKTKKGNPEQFNMDQLLSTIGYTSIDNLSEVCGHSSTTSQQGEGDYQSSGTRKATAFYCLDTHREGNNEDLLKQLHDSLYNVSFDDVVIDEADISAQSIDGGPKEPEDCLETEHVEDCKELEFDKQEGLQHSKKFYQHDSGQYFLLHSSLPENYRKSVDESYSRYKMESKESGNEEQEELLSESSEELAIVDGEENITRFCETNPFRNPFLHSPINSILDLSCCVREPTRGGNTIDVTAEVEQVKDDPNWEDVLEVQMNVTEPLKCMEPQDEEDNEDIIQTRTYWSNVGLMTEKKIDPKYLGPVDEGIGLESVPGVTLVHERDLSPVSEKVVWTTEPLQDSEETQSTQSSQDLDEKINYLNFPGKTLKEKKKKPKLITRLTRAISGIFRHKKNVRP